MKHTYLFLFFLLIAATLPAQLQRGDRLLTIASPGEVSGVNGVDVYDTGEFGTIFYDTRWEGGLGYVSATYGYVLHPRWVAGAGVSVGGTSSGGFDAAVALSPYLRYYLINRPNLLLFGEASTALGLGSEGFNTSDYVPLRAGVQFPVATNVLLTPELTYTVGPGANRLAATFGIDLLLGRNNRPDERATGSFAAGDLLLGGQLASLSLQRNYYAGVLSGGGHYFLSPRFAVGAGLTLQQSRFTSDFNAPSGDNVYRQTQIGGGLSARYYLNQERHLLWFLEAGGTYGRRSDKSPFTPDTDSYSELGLLGRVGAHLFVRDNIGLEITPELRYRHERYAIGNRSGVSLGMSFGVSFKL
ncbi:outer membrane beta-barrel protein [Lewinella sp. IMCC34183]|uniref:outer membrane beta-barrel protein n=1 Tax=Lewinella sp. IMCC34183 TaxID=2248762 RepID=UPI000E26B25C|nr:outer membrane beta-barrel protein [Lewinella sp. IMCC34183]